MNSARGCTRSLGARSPERESDTTNDIGVKSLTPPNPKDAINNANATHGDAYRQPAHHGAEIRRLELVPHFGSLAPPDALPFLAGALPSSQQRRRVLQVKVSHFAHGPARQHELSLGGAQRSDVVQTRKQAGDVFPVPGQRGDEGEQAVHEAGEE